MFRDATKMCVVSFLMSFVVQEERNVHIFHSFAFLLQTVSFK